MKCSQHSKERLKERVGLNAKAADRMAQKALTDGVRHDETTGSLNKFITALAFKNGRANKAKIRIYGRQVYIFSYVDDTLITVINLPHQYDTIVDKLMKKKKENSGN